MPCANLKRHLIHKELCILNGQLEFQQRKHVIGRQGGSRETGDRSSSPLWAPCLPRNVQKLRTATARVVHRITQSVGATGRVYMPPNATASHHATFLPYLSHSTNWDRNAKLLHLASGPTWRTVPENSQQSSTFSKGKPVYTYSIRYIQLYSYKKGACRLLNHEETLRARYRSQGSIQNQYQGDRSSLWT